MKIKNILVFTATYNEKDNIKNLINSIRENLPNASILIIDDNSPDNTQEIIKIMQSNDDKLNLIIREKKLGLDTAHKEAFRYALKNNFDFLVTMDADLSHDPKDLIEIVNHLDEFPFVIGSRYVEGGKCLMKGFRLKLSKYGNIFIKKLSGIDCNEFTTSYRGFNLGKLDDFNLSDVNVSGYSFFMGSIFEINKKKIPIKEVPITFYDSHNGVSKIPRIEIFRTLKTLIFLTIKKFLKI